MPSAREQALNAIKVGDVILGIAANGQYKLLLVHTADETGIFARHVTTGTRVEFGRDGRSRWCEGGGSCAIVSAAALPAEVYDTVIGLDHKMQTGKDLTTDFRLSKAEIRMLLTIDDYFRARPLPS